MSLLIVMRTPVFGIVKDVAAQIPLNLISFMHCSQESIARTNDKNIYSLTVALAGGKDCPWRAFDCPWRDVDIHGLTDKDVAEAMRDWHLYLDTEEEKKEEKEDTWTAAGRAIRDRNTSGELPLGSGLTIAADVGAAATDQL